MIGITVLASLLRAILNFILLTIVFFWFVFLMILSFIHWLIALHPYLFFSYPSSWFFYFYYPIFILLHLSPHIISSIHRKDLAPITIIFVILFPIPFITIFIINFYYSFYFYSSVFSWIFPQSPHCADWPRSDRPSKYAWHCIRYF